MHSKSLEQEKVKQETTTYKVINFKKLFKNAKSYQYKMGKSETYP